MAFNDEVNQLEFRSRFPNEPRFIGAARAKPKVRLCEPWVALKTIVRSRGAATASISSNEILE